LKPLNLLLFALANIRSRAMSAIPMAPITPLWGGTTIGFFKMTEKAAATASLKAVPP
jgi:hypothetical protein